MFTPTHSKHRVSLSLFVFSLFALLSICCLMFLTLFVWVSLNFSFYTKNLLFPYCCINLLSTHLLLSSSLLLFYSFSYFYRFKMFVLRIFCLCLLLSLSYNFFFSLRKNKILFANCLEIANATHSKHFFLTIYLWLSFNVRLYWASVSLL